VQFVTREVGTLQDKRILLVGAGKMGKVTCANLQSYCPSEITLVNRTKTRAQRLGKRYAQQPGVRVSRFEHLAAEFAWADVVIVATGSEHYVLRPEHLRCPAVGRKVVVDLSVPRNIDPAVGELPNVLLADLDTLQATTDSAYQERLAAVPAARAIVAHELDNYEHWQAAQRVAPTIRALHDKFDTIRRQELDYARHKLNAAEFDVLERITERIVRKIAAHSIDHLRSTPADAESVAELLREMFKLEPDKGHNPPALEHQPEPATQRA
jgi:glutamyl-tRNA reductase